MRLLIDPRRPGKAQGAPKPPPKESEDAIASEFLRLHTQVRKALQINNLVPAYLLWIIFHCCEIS